MKLEPQTADGTVLVVIRCPRCTKVDLTVERTPSLVFLGRRGVRSPDIAPLPEGRAPQRCGRCDDLYELDGAKVAAAVDRFDTVGKTQHITGEPDSA